MNGLDFPKRTERRLWIVLGFLCAFIFIVLLWGAIENALGAATVTTMETDTFDRSVIGRNDIARGPDNIIRYAYSTEAIEVNMSYSSNNGTSWTEITILAAAYNGATQVDVIGVVVSSNNTTAVAIRTKDADSTYDLYLLIRWAWSGSWEIVRMSGQATYDYTYGDVAINNTDIVLVVFLYNSAICYKTFDMNTRTVNPIEANAPIIYVSVSSPMNPQCVANLTGVFWVYCVYWDGANYRMSVRDLGKTLSERYLTFSSLFPPYTGGFHCLVNSGALVWAVGGNYAAVGYYGIYFYYLKQGSSTIQSRAIMWSTSPVIAYDKIGLSVDAANYCYIFVYDSTNNKVKRYRELYNADVIEWQNSLADAYSTGYAANDYVRGSGGLGGVYPRVNGVAVSVPKTGYLTSWIWKDELGATDDYSFQVARDSATWPYLFWAPPVIGNYTLPNWYESEPYLHDFSISSGNTPYVWWITWNDPSDGGWFLGDSNGTMYGYCPATNGTYSITIHVTDFYGLTTIRTTTLTILSRTAGAGSVSTPWDWPTLNEDADLWFILAAVSIAACIIGTVRNLSNRGRKRLEKLQRK